MEPLVVKAEEVEWRQLEAGSKLQIFFDSENGAKNLAMGIVAFEPGQKTTPHTRSVEEVIFVLEGTATIVTNREYTIPAGSAILIPPGVEHFHENKAQTELKQIYLFAPQGPEKALRSLQVIS